MGFVYIIRRISGYFYFIMNPDQGRKGSEKNMWKRTMKLNILHNS